MLLMQPTQQPMEPQPTDELSDAFAVQPTDELSAIFDALLAGSAQSAGQPTEQPTEPQPVESAQPTEQPAAPQPVEGAQPTEQPAEPQPVENAQPTEQPAEPQPVENAQPTEQPAESARKVTILVSRDTEELQLGSQITLTAVLEGYEGVPYTCSGNMPPQTAMGTSSGNGRTRRRTCFPSRIPSRRTICSPRGDFAWWRRMWVCPPSSKATCASRQEGELVP